MPLPDNPTHEEVSVIKDLYSVLRIASPSTPFRGLFVILN
jgi:hypothetical protein